MARGAALAAIAVAMLATAPPVRAMLSATVSDASGTICSATDNLVPGVLILPSSCSGTNPNFTTITGTVIGSPTLTTPDLSANQLSVTTSSLAVPFPDTLTINVVQTGLTVTGGAATVALGVNTLTGPNASATLSAAAPNGTTLLSQTFTGISHPAPTPVTLGPVTSDAVHFALTASGPNQTQATSIAIEAAPELHGYCAGTGQCLDNGTNSPTTTNPPAQFGFTASGGPVSGSQLLLDVLVPDNQNNPAAGPFGITGSGTGSGSATQVSPTAWNAGLLSTYLGLTPDPHTNPIGAFLPSTQAVDPGAMGFFVYQTPLPITMLSNVPHVSPLLSITSQLTGNALPQGSYIVAFLNQGSIGSPSWVGTANSGAIFVPTRRVPEPASLSLLGPALLGLAGLRWVRRRRKTV